jgi:hypothetical protein
MRQIISVGVIAMILFALSDGLPAPTVEAHQPYCEFVDLGPDNPWPIEDPSVSLAFYATLYPKDDVDYFTFTAEAGDFLYLGLTIPAIAGQEEFAPTMAVIGPDLPETSPDVLPADLELAEGMGAIVIPPSEEAPTLFFEPFSRTSYWERQDITLEAPASGAYWVLVWHPDNVLGRYVFVIGQREVLGGDVRCLASFREYWTPVKAGHNPYRAASAPTHTHRQ